MENSELREGEHYYFVPPGLMVFTEKYHLERGYCCRNGCMHCPNGFKKKSDQAEFYSTLTQGIEPDKEG